MRVHFHEELERLELDVLGMGELAEHAVERAVQALTQDDLALMQAVVGDDDVIDARYVDVEQRTFQVLALQTPVASDLRMVSVVLHSSLHLERIADMAVNIAKIAESVRGLPRSDRVLARIQEMGDVVRPMIRASMDALARRDLELCMRLPAMDDPVDRLNLGIYKEVLALSEDRATLDWGLRMVIVARQLERVGDHAVDIAEQVGFLITGEFREFTDASHPVDLEGDA